MLDATLRPLGILPYVVTVCLVIVETFGKL
jgi:hypothetical protein